MEKFLTIFKTFISKVRLPNWALSPTKVLFVLFLIFIGAQAFTGDQGLLSWRQYSLEVENLLKEKEQLKQQKQELEASIARLSTKTTNRDYLEQIAFEKLNMAQANDYVIILPKTEPK